MKHPHPLPSPRHYPDLNHARDLERLGDEITELAAHIHAATFQLLDLIRIFDEEQGWGGFGVNSCAHWLNWKCGMNTGAAREKVRVAHALAELPLITAAFREGRVSYSKVRAMTRVATRDNEDFLLSIARHGTANHVERLVSLYRRTKRNEALELDNRADALERVAESFLAGGKGDRCGGDRYLVHIHTEPDTLRVDGEGAESELEDKGRVSAETSRRMACDASVVHWHETDKGEPLSVGRKTRSIPPAIRRALKRRDGGCRFPGCTCSRFVDAHHIIHWADGGETKMDNLVLLCRQHHRMVHEGGFGVHSETSGDIQFTYPDGRIMAPGPDGRFSGNVVSIQRKNRKNGLDITSETLPPMWTGEIMDYDLAIMGLQSRE